MEMPLALVDKFEDVDEELTRLLGAVNTVCALGSENNSQRSVSSSRHS
jgi:hypothetical protein